MRFTPKKALSANVAERKEGFFKKSEAFFMSGRKNSFRCFKFWKYRQKEKRVKSLAFSLSNISKASRSVSHEDALLERSAYVGGW